MKTGEIIKSIMIEHNLSQEQLAKMIGVSQKAISNWINGIDKPNATSLILIYKKFGITPNELLELDEFAGTLPISDIPHSPATKLAEDYPDLFRDSSFIETAKLYGGVSPELRALALGYIVGIFQQHGVNTRALLGY